MERIVFQSLSIIPLPRRTDGWWGWLLLIIAFCAFVIRPLQRRAVLREYDVPESEKEIRGWNWIVLPAAILASVILRLSDVGGNSGFMYLAFNLSRPAFNSVARQVITTRSRLPEHRAGFYDMVDITPMTDGVDLCVKGHASSGFAYTTTGKPPLFRPNAMPMGGGWYAFDGS